MIVDANPSLIIEWETGGSEGGPLRVGPGAGANRVEYQTTRSPAINLARACVAREARSAGRSEFI